MGHLGFAKNLSLLKLLKVMKRSKMFSCALVILLDIKYSLN